MHIERDKTLNRDIDVKYSFNGKNLAGLILLAFNATTAQAADVPAGAKLAPVQELVRANGYEPATLDRTLAESNVEFYIFNDLFEGLLRVGKDGEAVPALAQKWEHQGNV